MRRFPFKLVCSSIQFESSVHQALIHQGIIRIIFLNTKYLFFKWLHYFFFREINRAESCLSLWRKTSTYVSYFHCFKSFCCQQILFGMCQPSSPWCKCELIYFEYIELPKLKCRFLNCPLKNIPFSLFIFWIINLLIFWACIWKITHWIWRPCNCMYFRLSKVSANKNSTNLEWIRTSFSRKKTHSFRWWQSFSTSLEIFEHFLIENHVLYEIYMKIL